MPTYEYGCTACGDQWEELQRITEPPIEVCPKCGKNTAQRLISAGTGFILKGGGWYSDLYSSAKSGSNKAEANGSTSSDSSSKADSGGKTETKSETKTASTSAPATPPAGSSS
ncbi:MAG TPA: zinc ribbon domain-containing protein [Polyangiaceae bacterium]|nr:zinc ribbon domain-containing protein [Polyangiaceae bacterium]